MPFAQIKVIEGVFSDDEKRQMVEKVSEALIAIEGEKMRDKTFVVVEEIKSGEWGIGGTPVTADDIKALRTG